MEELATKQEYKPIRLFRRWWMRDLQHNWPGLFAITALLLACNGLLFFAATYVLPDLGAVLSPQTFSGIIRAGVNILAQPLLLFGIVAVFFLLNTFFISWMTGSMERSMPRDEITQPISFVRRFSRVLLASMPAIGILLAVGLSGISLAYAVSRWYFGAVLPILAVTAVFVFLFALWFAYTPFVVVWDDTKGTKALSRSRKYVRFSLLRLCALFFALLVFCFLIATELDGFAVWLRTLLIIITFPVITSMLGTLYAEVRSRSLG